ncbi:twitching motility protein PilT [Desulfobaculum xiamenense]|uniref:Twitching motility protein PilT n=1 Tax=Desulfobaculum xiamenense TaxID=995050 RepID=A0A846QKA5_9BACT|nr:PilT/PilU family type 4a pilus ATPase [Desulfobaculum xiamenense]NJB66902.1 twitching motility protein PilT [Desulfobaculum xiamenense]
MLRSQFDHIIGQVLDHSPSTSDIFFVAGKPLQAEVHGKLENVPLDPAMGPFSPAQTESCAFCMMGQNQRLFDDLVQHGSCDLSYELLGRARFRVNIFSQRGALSIVMRQLSMKVPTVEQLGLPAIFHEMAHEKFGLVLVTGATGSGKSTTLAALIDSINAQFPVHILTLEDPVEFVHPHKMGTVNQREMGQDFDAFASGLRAALRQAPKVILVGEIRDRETIEIAMQAAETGHLVLGTLHTSDTGQTINRIIGMFDPTEEHLVRQRLGESLKFVVSQRLCPKEGGGRIAAFEILRNNLRIKDLVVNGETPEKTIYNVLETSETFGMMTFDQCLTKHFEEGKVSEETAMVYASDKSALMQRLDRIKTLRGDKVTDISGLELDADYGKE